MTGATVGEPSTLVLRYSTYRVLFAGRVVMMLGNAIAPVALAFAVLDLTGSLTMLSLVVGVRMAANVALALGGGVFADRFARHRVLIVSAVVAGISQALVAMTVLRAAATIPILLILSAVNGAAAAFALPAAAAAVPQTVPDTHVQQANALQRIGINAATILGGCLGGSLVAFAGPGVGLAVDAGTFLLSALIFTRLRLSTTVVTNTAFSRQLVDGWREFSARPWVWQVVAAFFVINACYAAEIEVLGPVVADDSFGRHGWALAMAAQALGMAVGAFVVLRLRVSRLLLVGCAAMMCVVAVPLVLLFLPVTSALVAAGFVAGVGLDVFGVAWETSLQQHIAADRLARVYSYDTLGSFVAIPAALLTVPFVVAAVGIDATLLGAVLLQLLSVAVMTSSPSVRRLEVVRVTVDADKSPPPMPR